MVMFNVMKNTYCHEKLLANIVLLYFLVVETGDMRDNSLEDDGAEEHEEFEELKGKARKSNKKGRSGKKKKALTPSFKSPSKPRL